MPPSPSPAAQLLSEPVRLPPDSCLLPLAAGALLVSRDHATFAYIAPAQLPQLRAWHDRSQPAVLEADLVKHLDAHGFFGPPRPPPPPAPSVQLQLTNACNLACAYCCTNSGDRRERELDREDWLALLSDVRASTTPDTALGLLGGEPFLQPFCVELADRAVDLGFALTIYSNGVPLVAPKLAQEAARLVHRGVQLRVSLAGPSRASCDAVSGAPRFEHVLAGLAELYRHGATATVDLILQPQHVGEMAEALPALRQLLPPGTPLAFGLVFRGGREQGNHMFASRSAVEAALDRIAFEAGETIAAVQPSPLAERRDGCSCAMGHHLHVRSDGGLFTCFRMEEQVGDAAVERFADVVQRVRSAPRPAQTLPFCQACPLASLCGGGCRAENQIFSGDANLPVCGPWRVQVLAQLLAEDRPAALHWSAPQLVAEALARGLDAPAMLEPARPSQHLIDT